MENRSRYTDFVSPFPGDVILTQTKHYSSRFESGVKEYSPGSEVQIQLVDIQSLQNDQELLRGLCVEIYNNLERPVFTIQSPQMPYEPVHVEKDGEVAANFEDLLNNPSAILVVFWEKGKMVGYSIGWRYKPGDIPVAERTNSLTGEIGEEPTEGDLIIDTWATDPSRRGDGLMRTGLQIILDRSRYQEVDGKILPPPEHVFSYAVNPTSLSEEARRLAFPFTKDILDKHPELKFVSLIYIDKYRGAGADYVMYDVLPKGGTIKE